MALVEFNSQEIVQVMQNNENHYHNHYKYVDNRRIIVVNVNLTGLDKKIIIAIRNVIERLQNDRGGRHIAFALQSEVGKELKRMNVKVRGGLMNYLKARPFIFNVGTHPSTNALTVSVKRSGSQNLLE